MTATRSITWGIPSTSSRMASRTIIPATFTARRNPGTVSQSLLRLRDFCAGMTTASGMLGGYLWRRFTRFPPWRADVGKNCYGWKENCISAMAARERALLSTWVCMYECELRICVCMCIRVDTLQLKLHFLTWKREVDLKNRKLASTARRYDVAVMCIRVLYKGIKLPKVSKLYRCISWPSWSQFFLNESMEVLYIRAISELYMCDRK